MEFLTIDDLDCDGKTVFLRADINSPVDRETGKLLDTSRISEAAVSIKELRKSKLVVASHQGRVGRYDYVSLNQHAKVLAEILGKDVTFVEDVHGPSAREAIRSLNEGDVLLLENLRFAAEENFEFKPEEAANTVLVRTLSKYFDACILDAFPTAHRSSPSIVGFAEVLPACAGRLVVKELKSLQRIEATAKGPYTTVLGGSKVSDRLEAIDALIENNKADKILLCGLIGSVFLRAAGIVNKPLGIDGEERYVSRARQLLDKYRDNFELPVDVAVNKDGERKEIEVSKVDDGRVILDIGSKTISKYSKIIRSSGTIFVSGPPGMFEKPGFDVGTHEILLSLASSLGTTIVSGGHLNAALEKYGIKDWIDHKSTSGGALVMYMAGKRLPMFEALRRAKERYGRDRGG